MNYNSFQINFDWQEKRLSQVEDILRENIGAIASIEIASEYKDKKHATDLVVKISGADVAVRLRRPKYSFRDLTIRSYNRGYNTEIHKMKNGYADWYLYGWFNQQDIISEWMILDINKMRADCVFDLDWNEKENIGGKTRFIIIPRQWLRNNGYIVKEAI